MRQAPPPSRPARAATGGRRFVVDEQQRRQVFGVLLLHREDFLEQPARRRIAVADVVDHLAIRLDRDALGDEIFLHHLAQRAAFDVFGVTAVGEPVGAEIRRAAELGDPLGDPARVLVFLLRVLTELGARRFRMPALRHVVVALVAQHADELGRERFVQELDHGAAIGAVIRGDRAALDLLARTLPNRLHVGQRAAVAAGVLLLHAFPLHLTGSVSSGPRSG